MSTHSRVAVLFAAVLLAGLLPWSSVNVAAAVQPPPAGATPVNPEPPLDLIPAANKLGRKLEAAQDYLREQSWAEACWLLQGILELREDQLIERPGKGADGKPGTVRVSVRSEADRLLDSMPAAGKAFYEHEYGPKAAALLTQAKAKKDPDAFGRIATLYFHTTAGAEALELHAVGASKAGEFGLAAARFERLLHRRDEKTWDATALFQAAVAFRKVGRQARVERVWKELQRRDKGDGVRIEEQVRSLADLQIELDRQAPPPPPGLVSWPIFRGDPSRSAQGIGGAALLEPMWHASLLREKQTEDALKLALAAQRERKLPLLPAMLSITAQLSAGNEMIPLVVYRSYWGVHATDIRTGKLRWESDSRWTMDRMFHDHRRAYYLNGWIQAYVGMGKQFLLWENSTVGSLSTDGRRVYLIEDFQVLPFNNNPGHDNFGRPTPYFLGGDPNINEAVRNNELHCLDIKSGKLLWNLPWNSGKRNAALSELDDSYFLSPPLPLDGKLYVLTERMQELRLVCLNSATIPSSENPILWVQTLATIRDRMLMEPRRRVQAAHVAFADGILVCPTNSGAVFGVDIDSHNIRWVQTYRPIEEAKPGVWGPALRLGQQIPKLPEPTDWHYSAPVIVDGRIVLTAPDSSEIHCLQLNDGSTCWTVPRAEGDCYLAGVVGGKVVIVGERSVRALDLDTGRPAWKELPTGTPSGLGVAAGGIYYLPLGSEVESKLPEICAIDIAKGVVVAHTRMRGQEAPGNLLFFNDHLVSHGIQEIVVYPLPKPAIERINKQNEISTDKRFLPYPALQPAAGERPPH